MENSYLRYRGIDLSDISPELGDEVIVQFGFLAEFDRLWTSYRIVTGKVGVESEVLSEQTAKVMALFGSGVITSIEPVQLDLRPGGGPCAELFVMLWAACRVTWKAPPFTIDEGWLHAVRRAFPRQVRLTSELRRFVRKVQSNIDPTLSEIRQMRPEQYATLALDRFLRIGVAESVGGRYDLTERLTSASGPELEAEAARLADPGLRYDPVTGEWAQPD